MENYIAWPLLVMIFVSIFCSGCSNQQTSKAKAQTLTTQHSAKAKHTKGKNHKQPKKDGTVILMKKIKVFKPSADLQAYRMMYWSKGTKTEAYVAAPKGPGTYALLVECHGGFSTANGGTHVASLSGGGGVIHLNKSLIQSAKPKMITVKPLYRGYGGSNGHVHGLYGDTVDTENAIKAVTSYFNSHKKYPGRQIQKGHIYLTGRSMGGGVVLKVASERKDVRSVIAISPFVGWDIVGTWDKKHPKHQRPFLSNATDEYGPFKPQSPKYKKQSIDYKKIQAPVLLVQGSADHNVLWQTVQILYQKMKANHQNVTFKLVKGGNHGLKNKPKALNSILNQWNAQHWVD